MKRLHKYFQPSLLSLPTYLGLFTFALILLYLSYQIQQLAISIRTAQTFPAQTRDQPIGKIHAAKTNVANTDDTITFTADAWPKEGKVEYIRYYLLNPTLGVNNDWGAPNWCSCGRVCSVSDECTLKTWDLGESGDANRGYQMTWGPETTSGISTQVSRKLNVINIPPGQYDVYIQVKDTGGNINEAADSVKITVTGNNSVLGTQSTPEITITRCAEQQEDALYSFAWEDTNRGPNPVSHYYQIDQGGWTPITQDTIALAFSPETDHRFVIQSIDAAGLSAVASCRFTAH